MIDDEMIAPVREPFGCQRSEDVVPERRAVMEYGALLSIQSPCGCIVKVWVKGEPNSVVVKIGAPGVPPATIE